MKRLLLLIALFLSFYQLSVAQCNTADIPSTCDNPVEDFTNFNGSGFAPMPTTGQLCSDRWAITGFSDGDLDFGDTNTSGDYARGDTDGGVGTGGLYGYDDGNSNQAIWIQATGSDFNTGTLTYQICNNSGTTLQNIEIQYDILAFNDQNRSSSFNFSYSIDDTNYTTIPSLDFTSDEAEDTDPQVQTINRNTTIENINLADGVCLFLRWTSEDVGGSGSRDELGLDNIFVCEASVSNECAITNVTIQNAACQDEDYVFEVTFDEENSSGNFEVFDTDNNTVLASGTTSPITVTLSNNTSTTPFNIIVRDENDNSCASENIEVTPDDCSPLICANAGDLVITEIIQNPDAVSDANGEWFELYNPTANAIDLKSYIIRDSGSDSHEIANSVIVPAGGYVVLARNANNTTNGGFTADYEYSGFTLVNSSDEVIIECNGVVIDSVGYDDGATFPDPSGASMSLNPNNLNSTDNDNGANWCEATSTYGDGDLGTPGAANDACAVCEITNIAIQNAACQGEDYVFEVAFDASNSSGEFEVFDVTNNTALASGTASPIEVILVGNISTTPFNIIVRDTNDNTCASEEVEVTPADCTPPCEITNIATQNESCQGEDYIFEVAFEASNSSGEFEVFDVTNNTVLASGNTSPIEVTLIRNTSTTPFNIIVRDANDNSCASEEVEVTPEDCTPPCEITNVAIQNATCQDLNYVFEVTFNASNSSDEFEVINADDNTILASGTASPIEVILANNSSTTPINIIVRDATDNACQSESVDVTPEDCVASCMQASARINEFHYDNDGADVNEFVEIFIPNPQPTNLSEYQIDLYNGNDGEVYETVTLDQTIVTSDANGSYYVWEETLQNGPDGIALSGNCGLIEFISYEGVFTATEGVANGIESTDIGVEESPTEAEQSSIQLINGVWQVTSAFNTKGAENALPPCEITNTTIQNASCQGEDYVFEVTFDASNSSGDFEIFDVTNNLVLASGTASPIEVTLVGNTSTTPFNIIVRDANDNTCASEEVEVTPEDCTPP
ncbi:MAG: lamin tail domain-containing protein, partial [Bacteroidota bacterium]